MKFGRTKSVLSVLGDLIVAVVVMLALLCAGLSAPKVQAADDAGPSYYVSSGTLTNAATWSSIGNPIKVDKNRAVALFIRFQGNGSSTSDVVVTLARSGDGTNFETSPPSTLKFTNALANTTAVIAYHEIPETLLRSAHSIKCVSAVNAASSVSATNVYIGLVKKKEQ